MKNTDLPWAGYEFEALRNLLTKHLNMCIVAKSASKCNVNKLAQMLGNAFDALDNLEEPLFKTSLAFAGPEHEALRTQLVHYINKCRVQAMRNEGESSSAPLLSAMIVAATGFIEDFIVDPPVYVGDENAVDFLVIQYPDQNVVYWDLVDDNGNWYVTNVAVQGCSVVYDDSGEGTNFTGDDVVITTRCFVDRVSHSVPYTITEDDVGLEVTATETGTNFGGSVSGVTQNFFEVRDIAVFPSVPSVELTGGSGEITVQFDGGSSPGLLYEVRIPTLPGNGPGAGRYQFSDEGPHVISGVSAGSYTANLVRSYNGEDFVKNRLVTVAISVPVTVTA